MRYLTILAVCWVTGIAVGLERLHGGLGLLIACTFTISAAIVQRLPRRRWVALTIAAAISLGCAWGYASWMEARNYSSIPRSMENQSVFMIGRIASMVEIDGDRVRFVLRGERLDTGEGFKPLEEKLQVQIRLLSEKEAETAQSLSRGDRIQLDGELKLPSEAGNFGAFDYRKYLHDQGIHWLLSAKGLEQVQTVEGDWSQLDTWLGWRDRFQITLANHLDSIVQEPFSGFLKGLLIGYQDDINEEQFQQFSTLGLTHILAISGLHVGVLASIIMMFCRIFRMTRETSYTLCMILIPVYVLLTGASPSAVRAGIMTVLALYAWKRQMLKDTVHMVALTAVLMLLWNPYFAVNISFQLSFIVTLGLIVCGPAVYSFLPERWWASVRSLLSVTLTAQWISFPISIYYFNSFSLLSGLANFLIVPFISFLLFPAALFSFAVSFIWPWLGEWGSSVVAWGLQLVFDFVEWLTTFESFHLIWTSPRLEWILLYFAVSLWLVYEMKSYKSEKLWRRGLPFDAMQPRRWALCGTCITLIVLIGYQYVSPWLDSSARIQFLDVGQGDSALIVTPDQRTILVDGGGTLSFLKQGEEWKMRSDPYEVGQDLLVPLLKKRGIRAIDLMIATHGDMDHIGGLRAVIESFPVHAIWMNGTYETSGAYRELLQLALDHDIPIYSPSEGESYRVDDNTQIKVLLPSTKSGEDGPYIAAKQNDASLVFMLTVYDKQLLFTGDMGQAQENSWLKQFARNKPMGDELTQADNNSAEGLHAGGSHHDDVIGGIDVMKVAHHGSKYSTTDDWLHYWKPMYSIISAGRNNVYGHPTEEVLQRLDAAGSGIYRTDQHGEIQIFIDQRKMEIRTKHKVFAAE